MSGHTHKSAARRYRGKIHAVFPACAYGIGESCGWGCVVVSKTDVHSVFVKELAASPPATATFDHVSWELAERPGGFRRLETPLFENSPLCHPHRLPQADTPVERS